MASNLLTQAQIDRAREVYKAALDFNDPDPLGFVAQGFQESRFNARAVSNKNARGEWQFIPETAKKFGVDTSDPDSSMLGALKYRQYIRDYNKAHYGTSDEKYVWSGYNAGEGRSIVAASKFDETRNYISSILAHKAMFAPILGVSDDTSLASATPPTAATPQGSSDAQAFLAQFSTSGGTVTAPKPYTPPHTVDVKGSLPSIDDLLKGLQNDTKQPALSQPFNNGSPRYQTWESILGY